MATKLVPDIVELDVSKDGDVCNQKELNQLYQNPYHCSARKAVGLEKLYILHLDCQWDNNKLAAGLSNNSIHLTSTDTLDKISTFIAHNQNLVDIHFHPADPNSLLSASSDGTVRMWDIRNPQRHTQEYRDNQGQPTKPFLSFDINSDGKLLCVGTEKIKKEMSSFLLFWDVRYSNKLLREFSEFHEDDISHVQFHHTSPNTLATCSTDCLINIFDVSQEDEDEALQFSLNPETPCERLDWLCYNKKLKQETLSVLTYSEGVQIWNVEEAAPTYSFSRSSITDALRRKNVETCYSIRCFNMGENADPLLLAGSNTPNKGCLRLLKMKDSQLEPYAILYDDRGGNSQTIRAAKLNQRNGQIVTGGEDGIINVWMPGQGSASTKSNPMVELPSRQAQKKRANARKPYMK